MTGPSVRLPPDLRRRARFREIARAIVAKDRSDRKYGLTVDTADAIAPAKNAPIATACAMVRQRWRQCRGSPIPVWSNRR